MDFRWLEINLETSHCGRIGRMEDVKNGYNLKSSGIKYHFFGFHGIVNLRLFMANTTEEWYNRKCMEQKTFDLKVFDFE